MPVAAVLTNDLRLILFINLLQSLLLVKESRRWIDSFATLGASEDQTQRKYDNRQGSEDEYWLTFIFTFYNHLVTFL
jgi:hypothetical protein